MVLIFMVDGKTRCYDLFIKKKKKKEEKNFLKFETEALLKMLQKYIMKV